MSSEIEVVEDEVQTHDRESASANSANNNGEANGIWRSFRGWWSVRVALFPRPMGSATMPSSGPLSTTALPPTAVYPSLSPGLFTPDVPSSIGLAMALITGDDFLINMALKGMQMLSGSISITHVEDVCRAHIFLAEKESASGRYICCAANTGVPELAKFLNKRYPQYKVPTEFGDFPSKAKLIISSEKLIKEGFDFKYGIEEIYDQTVEYFKAKGLLQN